MLAKLSIALDDVWWRYSWLSSG